MRDAPNLARNQKELGKGGCACAQIVDKSLQLHVFLPSWRQLTRLIQLRAVIFLKEQIKNKNDITKTNKLPKYS